MKVIFAILIALVLVLQYRLWFGEGSLEQVAQLKREIAKQEAENTRLEERNRILMAQIEDLRHGLESIEEKARQDMGMIKEGETFYLIVDENDDKK